MRSNKKYKSLLLMLNQSPYLDELAIKKDLPFSLRLNFAEIAISQLSRLSKGHLKERFDLKWPEGVKNGKHFLRNFNSYIDKEHFLLLASIQPSKENAEFFMSFTLEEFIDLTYGELSRRTTYTKDLLLHQLRVQSENAQRDSENLRRLKAEVEEFEFSKEDLQEDLSNLTIRVERIGLSWPATLLLSILSALLISVYFEFVRKSFRAELKK